MSGNAMSSNVRYRPLKAFLAVCALVLAVPGADVVIRTASEAQASPAVGSASQGIHAGSLLDVSDAFGSLDRIEAVAQEVDSILSESFSREVGLLPGARDVRVSSGGDVVGYLVAGECGDVFDKVSQHMERLGWTAVPLGGTQGATFVKARGDYTWVLITCTQVGEQTAVVARSVPS